MEVGGGIFPVTNSDKSNFRPRSLPRFRGADKRRREKTLAILMKEHFLDDASGQTPLTLQMNECSQDRENLKTNVRMFLGSIYEGTQAC